MGRFHALLAVRDEGDIIEQSLNHFTSWADVVHVFDTGSVDGTWESVKVMARDDESIHPVGRKPVYFSLSKVRSHLFHEARKHMQDGDWLLRVDADERYHIPPPAFVEKHMKPYEKVAKRQYYDFRLTDKEVQWWKDGKEGIEDRGRPIEDRRRFYTIKKSPEPRLCQYRPTMRWPPYASFPCNAGIIAEEPLPIRHYPHRDPVQMAKRFALRSIQVRAEGSKTEKGLGHHWAVEDWKKDVIDGTREDLRYWEPGNSLPRIERDDITTPEPTRLMKRLVYSLPLPVVDRMREVYDSFRYGNNFDEKLDPLPPEIQERVREAYERIEKSSASK